MTDAEMEVFLSVRSDQSDHSVFKKEYRSDAIAPLSDRSDHCSLIRSAGPTGPTADVTCRTENRPHYQGGPTGPTGPTQIDIGERLAAARAVLARSAIPVFGAASRTCDVLVEPQPAPNSFGQPSAIAKHDGDVSPSAEDVEAPLPTRVREWLMRLEAINDRAARRYVENARAFTAEGWAVQAASLGWSEHAIFGVCPTAPWARLDRMGAAWFGSARAVTADTVTIVGGNTVWRTRQALGAVLPWEAV